MTLKHANILIPKKKLIQQTGEVYNCRTDTKYQNHFNKNIEIRLKERKLLDKEVGDISIIWS